MGCLAASGPTSLTGQVISRNGEFILEEDLSQLSWAIGAGDSDRDALKIQPLRFDLFATKYALFSPVF